MFRFRGSTRQGLAVGLSAGVLAVGVYVGTLQSAEWKWRKPLAREVGPPTELEPVRALPRTVSVLALLEAEYHLENGRPYSAWQALRPFIDMEGPTGIAINLAAARAATQWGDWDRVRSVLVGRPWLFTASEGIGLFYLSRAEEELGSLNAASEAYRAYVNSGQATNRGVANARWAGVLDRMGLHADASAAYRSATADLPEIADWLETAALEQSMKSGSVEIGDLTQARSAPVRMRRAALEAAPLAAAAQINAATELLERQARLLIAEGAPTEAARLNLERARLILASSTPSTGRDLLRLTAADNAIPASVRAEAARMLETLGVLSVSEELARAAAYQAALQPGLAADALQAALDAGATDNAETRLRLAQLRYEERDYPAARAAFGWAAELVEGPEATAYAELYAARSLYRSGGSRAERDAIAEFGRIAQQNGSTAAAGTALFLLGDEAASVQTALGYYRRAAAIGHSPDAREALYRVGDRSLRTGNRAGAIEAWEDYVGRYPTGEQTTLVAYELGKLYESAGRRADARTAFNTALTAEPTSYWSVRASERLGVRPLDTVLTQPKPWIGLASDPAEATAVLRRLDALDAVGLASDRELEYQAALRAFARKPLALLTLAEGIRDRNQPVEAINLGRQLLLSRGGAWDERLLQLVYPFPYRQLIVAESQRAGIDPLLYAALIRQESTFRPTIKSRVGATGLGQIMPATGQWLAPSVGILDYDPALLEVPEVNLRMGTKFFGDLLTRYGGAADLALAGYNAGPSRADRWRREFNYGRDIDAFRAAIPFDETRNYVTIVLRNAAIYKRLYGSEISTFALQGN